MSQDMAGEAMEVITMSIDKHQATKNYEVGGPSFRSIFFFFFEILDS